MPGRDLRYPRRALEAPTFEGFSFFSARLFRFGRSCAASIDSGGTLLLFTPPTISSNHRLDADENPRSASTFEAQYPHTTNPALDPRSYRAKIDLIGEMPIHRPSISSERLHSPKRIEARWRGVRRQKKRCVDRFMIDASNPPLLARSPRSKDSIDHGAWHLSVLAKPGRTGRTRRPHPSRSARFFS